MTEDELRLKRERFTAEPHNRGAFFEDLAGEVRRLTAARDDQSRYEARLRKASDEAIDVLTRHLAETVADRDAFLERQRRAIDMARAQDRVDFFNVLTGNGAHVPKTEVDQLKRERDELCFALDQALTAIDEVESEPGRGSGSIFDWQLGLKLIRANPAAAVDARDRKDREMEFKLDNLVAEHKSLERDRDEKAMQLKAVKTDAAGVWFWQGEGDRPESLVCPVVMSADTLRGLVAEREEAEQLRELVKVATGRADDNFNAGELLKRRLEAAYAANDGLKRALDEAGCVQPIAGTGWANNRALKAEGELLVLQRALRKVHTAKAGESWWFKQEGLLDEHEKRAVAAALT